MSMRSETIFLLLTWGAFIITHQAFLFLDFFWIFWWADIFMHTWGGAMVVLSWYTVERTQAFPRTMALKYNHTLLFLVAVMIGWEIFEYAFGIANTTDYVFDTLLDFLTGGLGGLVAYLLCRSRTINDIKL